MLFSLLWSIPIALAGTCGSYAEAEFILETKGIESNESSGLAASRSRPGVFFTHDDSGASAEIFSFSLDGNVGESHSIDGATPIDWEDMAAARCPESVQTQNLIGDCLYIGDIGDNPRNRDEIQIYVTAEPSEGASLQVLETWNLRYPDGPRDSEAMMIHPGTLQVTLVTKNWKGSVEIYTAAEPPADGESALLELQGELDLEAGGAAGSLITGGDWDADGERLALRTYAHLYVWETDPCLPDAHWGDEPQRLLTTWEWQGEAICFDLNGGLLTSSEGNPMPVSRLECTDWAAGEGPCDTGEDSEGSDTGQASPVDTGESDSSSSPNPHPGGSTPTDLESCGRGASMTFLLVGFGASLRSRRRDPSVRTD